MDNLTNSTHQGMALKQIVFLDAADLNTTDFACYFDANTQTITQLTVGQDPEKNTMTISLDGSTIKMIDVQWLKFGKNDTDLNLCATNPSSYNWAAVPSLTNSTSTGTLVSSYNNTALYPNLTVEMKMLKTGALNVKWMYADSNMSGYTAPFEVPTDIVNTKRNETMNGAILSNYINVGDGAQSPLLSVKNSNSTVIYDLGSLVLKEHFNYISQSVHVKSGDDFKGIMGLAERTGSDLFLNDNGIYALWSRDIPNPVEDARLPGKNLYGVHPFYMGRASDDTWFGVYTNVAAAQDWTVKNTASNGLVDLTMTAAGGLGDLYFMMAAKPTDVAKMYQSAIVGTPVLTPQWALGWN